MEKLFDLLKLLVVQDGSFNIEMRGRRKGRRGRRGGRGGSSIKIYDGNSSE